MRTVRRNTTRDPDFSAPPWYAAGLAFECQTCGRCCAGPEEGYVWCTEEEIAAIARHLNLGEKEFRQRHVRRVGRRLTLIENPQTNDCIFLKSGKCKIYDVRPTQCRTWPFWASNLGSPEDWILAGMRCSGVNRGSLHGPEEIREKLKETRE